MIDQRPRYRTDGHQNLGILRPHFLWNAATPERYLNHAGRRRNAAVIQSNLISSDDPARVPLRLNWTPIPTPDNIDGCQDAHKPDCVE
jgi:hypothetical protein